MNTPIVSPLTLMWRKGQSDQRHYFLGNTPRRDMLCLAENEGNDYRKPLDLLFAASGDPRNIFETISLVPDAYDAPLSVTMNDPDPYISIRNFLMLAAMFLYEDAADIVFHIWYSTRVPARVWAPFKDLLLPSIRQVLLGLRNESFETIGHLELRHRESTLGVLDVCFDKLAWRLAEEFMNKEPGDDAGKSLEIPQILTACDRDLGIPKSILNCTDKWRQCGVFGCYEETNVQGIYFLNETFFDSGFCLMSGTEVMDIIRSHDLMAKYVDKQVGSPVSQSSERESGLPCSGFCVELQDEVFGLVQRFGNRLSRLKQFRVSVRAHQFGPDSPVFPPEADGPELYDRIDTSNIADVEHLGQQQTLKTFLPKLKPFAWNPFSTLILQFIDGPAIRRQEGISTKYNLKRGNTIMPETFPVTITWGTASVGQYLEWQRA